MNTYLRDTRYWQLALLIFGAYAIFFFAQMPQVYLYALENPQVGSPGNLFGRLAWGTFFSALTTPLVLWLGYRFPITRLHLWGNLSLHLLFSILTGALQHVGCVVGLRVLGLATYEDYGGQIGTAYMLLNNMTVTMLRYSVTLGAQHAYRYFRESQENSLRLKEAELEMLKMQLHPHFFFNTLNAISALIHRAPKVADQMIVQLGDVFRIALKKDKAQKVTLNEELEFLHAFLEIHKTLMGDKLQVEWSVEVAALDALVPNLLLQPLVENSIQHGIGQLEEGGRISISAKKRDGELRLRVADTGPGLSAVGSVEVYGIGLSNTKARLENLYRHEFDFLIESFEGFSITIRIPFEAEMPSQKLSSSAYTLNPNISADKNLL